MHKKCVISNCTIEAWKDDFCKEHYAQIDVPIELPPRKCSVAGCTRKYRANGLCNTHYKMIRWHVKHPSAVYRQKTIERDNIVDVLRQLQNEQLRKEY